MTRDPGCWACLVWPVDERDAEQTYAARLDANHGWTGGQHVYGNGRLVLPVSGYEREPDPTTPRCERCGDIRMPGRRCLNCYRSPLQRAQRWSA